MKTPEEGGRRGDTDGTNPVTSSYGKYRIIYRVSYKSGDAGFLKHQQYHREKHKPKKTNKKKTWFWVPLFC